MTSIIDMVVPPTGEAIDSARLVRWIILPGQVFKTGDVLLEIETDKSIIEIPALEDGVMIEHLVNADGLLNADTPIARIQVDGEPCSQGRDEESKRPAVKEERGSPGSSGATAAGKDVPSGRDSVSTGMSHERKFISPAARRLAGEHGIAIDTIGGTGPNKRVTQADLLRVLPPSVRSEAVDAGMAASSRTGTHESIVSTAHGEISINLWESGTRRSGPTVVLIHGIFGDSNTWASTAQAINRAGLRVLAMDLPCHGKTKSEITGFAEIVESVSEVITKQCEGPLVLIGHSFGGAIAARVARKPNFNVESLILIAPVGMGTEIDQSFLNGMTYAESNEAMLRELTKLTAAQITPSIAYINELRRGLEVRRDRMIDVCRQVSRNGVQQLYAVPDLVGLQCPTVVIQGRRDEIVPWQHVLNIPARVAIHLLPDAGHMPQWEATTLTTEIILDTIFR